MSSSTDDDIFIFESSGLKLKYKVTSVHAINRDRKLHGKCHHLFI